MNYANTRIYIFRAVVCITSFCQLIAASPILAQDIPPRKKWFRSPSGTEIIESSISKYRKQVEDILTQNWHDTWKRSSDSVFFTVTLNQAGKLMKLELIATTATCTVDQAEVKAATRALQLSKFPPIPAELNTKTVDIPVYFSKLKPHGISLAQGALAPRERKRLNELPEVIALLMTKRQFREAEIKQREYVSLLNKSSVDSDVKVRAMRLLATILKLNGKLAEAEAVCRSSLTRCNDWSGKDQLVNLLLHERKYREAEQLANENIQLLAEEDNESIKALRLSRTHLQLGHAQFCIGKFDEAQASYEHAVEFGKQSESDDPFEEVAALKALADLYRAKKMPEIAERYAKQADALRQGNERRQ